MTKLTQKQVWNKLASEWNRFRQKPPVEILNFLRDKKGKILDLGCGSGRNMFKQEKQEQIEYYGVDFSEKMIELAKKKAEELGVSAKFKCSDLAKLDFDDEFFDCSIFISTLHCIEGEKIRRKALEELFRVLKPDSQAMISVWDKNKEDKLGNIEAKEGFINWQNNGENYLRYYYFYDKDELIYLLKDVGFEVLKSEEVDAEIKHVKRNIVVYVKKPN